MIMVLSDDGSGHDARMNVVVLEERIYKAKTIYL